MQVRTRKVQATLVLQSARRGQLERRKYRKMIGGFIQLQRLYRRRRRMYNSLPQALASDKLIWEEDPQAKADFERTFHNLVEKRQEEEALYDKIAHTDASQFFSMAAFCNQPQSPKKKTAVPSVDLLHADNQFCF